MLHEKANESFHWKNKLDELDHLPGESASDKGALWTKLHDRLREKPVNRGLIWYRLAAACLLILAGILWIKPNHDRDKIVVDRNQPTPERPMNKSEINIEKNLVTDVKEILPEGRTKQASKISLKRVNSSVNKNTILPENVVEDLATEKESISEIVVQRNPFPDTTNQNTIATSVPRKLRVVHINDLIKPAEEMPYAKVTLQAPFQRKLSQQNDLPALSLSKNASDNLVKIKLSPSN